MRSARNFHLFQNAREPGSRCCGRPEGLHGSTKTLWRQRVADNRKPLWTIGNRRVTPSYCRNPNWWPPIVSLPVCLSFWFSYVIRCSGFQGIASHWHFKDRDFRVKGRNENRNKMKIRAKRKGSIRGRRRLPGELSRLSSSLIHVLVLENKSVHGSGRRALRSVIIADLDQGRSLVFAIFPR